MKSRHKKLALIGGALAVIGIITFFVLNALNSNLQFSITPTEVAAGEIPQGKIFRLGGLVKEGSLKRQADGVTMSFIITDTVKDLTVNYKGILPDLFKEGKGAVAQGKMSPDGTFAAQEVLAKHDENYMPPEAAKAIDDAQARAAGKHVSPSSSGDKPKASY